MSTVGPVVSLPAGKLMLAIGAMYKRDEYYYRADRIATVFLADGEPDIQGFSPTDDIDASTWHHGHLPRGVVTAARGPPWCAVAGRSARLPPQRMRPGRWSGCVEGRAALQTQRHTAAARPQRAVRAPSVFELYLPRLPITYFFDEAPDPCVLQRSTHGTERRRDESLCLARCPELLDDFVQNDDFTGVGGGIPS
jgi:hypothetical protein